MNKNILVSVMVCVFVVIPLTSSQVHAQSDNILGFDVSSVSVCTTNDASCAKKNAELRVVVQALLVQVLSKIAQQEKDLLDSVAQDGDVIQSQVDDKLYEDPVEENETIEYKVHNGKVRGINSATHPTIPTVWNMFAGVVPQEYLDRFVRYEVYNKPHDQWAASVRQYATLRGSTVQKEEWTLKVNTAFVSLLSKSDRNQLAKLLTHEAAHVFVLQTDQFDYDVSERRCDNYYSEGLRGCSKDDAYLTQMNEYWSDEYLDWSEDYLRKARRDSSYEESQRMLDDYYRQHSEQFVSRYAATEPNEDIAETIMHFATKPLPIGNIKEAEEKILEFYQYDEMLEMRKRVQDMIK